MIALVGFPSNAIVVIEIEQLMRCPSASDFASLFGMDRPSSPSSLRQFATMRLRLHGSVLD
jgi:hypothetical protein